MRIVDVNQLLTLPSSLLKVPAQVFEVYLCGVKPRDLDTDWPEEASFLAYECNLDYTVCCYCRLLFI